MERARIAPFGKVCVRSCVPSCFSRWPPYGFWLRPPISWRPTHAAILLWLVYCNYLTSLTILDVRWWPTVMLWQVGIVFSNICCQLIVAQMSNTRCEIFNWLLIPVGVAVAAALMLPSSWLLELPILYSLTAFTFLAHVHYGVCLVSCTNV